MNSVRKDEDGSANLDVALEAVGASDDVEFLTGEELTIDHIHRLSSMYISDVLYGDIHIGLESFG